jgi:hypothetical protein
VSCSYDPDRKDRWGRASKRGNSSWPQSPFFDSREARRQQELLRQQLQQEMQQRPPWQTMLLPALGLGFLTLLFGEN